jgi:hypothetical protein
MLALAVHQSGYNISNPFKCSTLFTPETAVHANRPDDKKDLEVVVASTQHMLPACAAASATSR